MADNPDLDRVSMIVLRAMRLPLLSLFMVYVVGIAGFGLVPGRDGEGMSFLHGLYILAYTATTTGFGELPVPFSEAQRVWVIVVLHVSVVAWLYSIGSLIRLVQNAHFRRALAQRVFSRRVLRTDVPFVIICGFGDAGSLLARGLNDSAIATVVIDKDPDRIKALALRNFDVQVLGVCADGGQPNQLLDAGLRHPHCRGLVAVTDDEHVNVTATIMTLALNPALRPICHVHSRERAAELEALGSVLVLDSFEVFADRLCAALYRPAVHALGNWFAQVAGANLDHRIECPAGHWIVCGYGRMGHRIVENLAERDIRAVVIDPAIAEGDANADRIRGSADRDTLARADVTRAGCVIVATDDDAANLRIMMTVRDLTPEVFLVIRQNHHSNEVAFTGAPVDLVMHPERVVARRAQLELVSPGLQPLLDHLQTCPKAELDALLERLRERMGDEAPNLWVSEIDPESATALSGRISTNKSIEPRLGDLVRDPRRRDESLACVPLQLERRGELCPVPDLDTALESGDRVLFCGTWQARTAIEAALRNPYTLEYLVSGEEPPRSYFFRWLESRRESASTPGPSRPPAG